MISIIPSTLLQHGYFSGVTSKTLDRSNGASSTQDQASKTTQDSVIISVSVKTQATDKQTASDAVAAFLVEQGRSLYETAVKNLKTYPENLAVKMHDTSLSQEARSAAANALAEREMDAFMKYALQSPPDMKMYYEKYVEYLDSLSLEENQSQRYRGQRAIAVAMYEKWARREGTEPADLSRVQDPILILFEEIEARNFDIENAEGFRKHYEQLVAPMFDRDSGPRFREDADRALERFDAVQLALEAARDGDDTAFEWLQKLAEDGAFTDDFMSNTKELTQPETA